MKKNILFGALALVMSAYAQTREDTILIQGRDIPEVSIVARVEQPADTRKKLSYEQLNRDNTGQNLPFLLQNTPSLLATSDDGLGVGYTYFRVRGTDHARINMTVNDVPLNDAESQTVFWVNMTDMSSSVSQVDVQRGV
jgi:iron complex outermembrane receptor protein